MATREEKADRLEEIHGEIATLIYEASEVLQDCGGGTRERAQRYWITVMEGCLGEPGEPRLGCWPTMTIMTDTITELRDEQ